MTRPDQEAAPVADDGWNRLSPWGIGTRVVKAVPSLIPALIGVFFLGRAAGPVFFVIAGVAISVLVGLLPWLTTRWRVTALPSAPLPVPGVGRPRWFVELIRCRAGACADFELEACDETGRLALPPHLADRSAATPAWTRRAVA